MNEVELYVNMDKPQRQCKKESKHIRRAYHLSTV